MDDEERKKYDEELKRYEKAWDELFWNFVWISVWSTLDEMRRKPLWGVALVVTLIAELSYEASMLRWLLVIDIFGGLIDLLPRSSPKKAAAN